MTGGRQWAQDLQPGRSLCSQSSELFLYASLPPKAGVTTFSVLVASCLFFFYPSAHELPESLERGPVLPEQHQNQGRGDRAPLPGSLAGPWPGC